MQKRKGIKNIIITEKQYQYIIDESIKDELKSNQTALLNYIVSKDKKLYDFYCIIDEEQSMFNDVPIEYSGLPVIILVDNNQAFIANNHEPWILFMNGHTKDCFPLPMTISDKPVVPINLPLNITNDEYNALCVFVITHKELLLNLAKSEISDTYFYDTLEAEQYKSEIAEDLLLEMPVLRFEDSGLNLNLWIDTGQRYVKGDHWKRIKFENPKGEKKTTQWGTLLMDPISIDKNTKIEVSQKDIKAMVSFVKINYKVLDDALSGRITFPELKKKLIKVDKKGEPILQ